MVAQNTSQKAGTDNPRAKPRNSGLDCKLQRVCYGEPAPIALVPQTHAQDGQLASHRARAPPGHCPVPPMVGTKNITALLRCGVAIWPMSARGLGCVKTPALAADVETFWRNCISGSRRCCTPRDSMPCGRIGFSP